jgi:thiol:disulfide interchange protein DsbC
MRFTLTLILFLITIFFTPSYSFSFEGKGCSGDCASCHSLTKDEASKILKIDVSDVKDSPVKGLWEIDGIQNGNKVRVHIDFSKKYVVLVNRFIAIEDIGKPPPIRKIDLNLIPLTDALIIGNPSAKNRVIVFTDPDCPYCRKFHAEMKEAIKKNKDIAFYIKLFPLVNVHPEAYEKSKAILCKNSLKLLDDAIEGKKLPKADCDTKTVDENIKLTERLDINVTPSIILPDGRLIPGFIDSTTLLQMISEKQ